MSREVIYLILGLIVTAVVGVIILQLQLIQTGLRVNEERYDKAIQSSLKEAALDVERKEADQIRYAANGYTAGGANIRPGYLTQRIKSTILPGGVQLTLTERSAYPYSAQFAAYDLEDRIDRSELHDKLTTEFRNSGLKGPVEYGVFDNRLGKFIFRNGKILSEAGSDTIYHQDLMNSEYRVSLFEVEGDVPGILMAHSPNKESIVYSSLYWNFAGSLLFAAIILGCFVYTIYVILRQKKLSEMKTDFINNMTHEFKTPIATISLATDSISSPRVRSDPKKVERFANIIKQENRRMNRQVNKVLQMAKLDKDRLNLKLTEVDVHEVIRDAADYIRLHVEPKSGTVTTELLAEPSVIQADETHVSSLINNLLDNANKYTPENPRIGVTTRTVAAGLQIIVTDNGIGMSREARKNIFDRFYRVPTGDRHDVKGFGLGLSYVKTIAEVHGGGVIVKSELGKGSSFIVTFPYLQKS